MASLDHLWWKEVGFFKSFRFLATRVENFIQDYHNLIRTSTHQELIECRIQQVCNSSNISNNLPIKTSLESLKSFSCRTIAPPYTRRNHLIRHFEWKNADCNESSLSNGFLRQYKTFYDPFIQLLMYYAFHVLLRCKWTSKLFNIRLWCYTTVARRWRQQMYRD